MQDIKEVKINETGQRDRSPLILRYSIAALIIAAISFFAGGAYRSNNLRFQYISQSEILTLEKERTLAQNIHDRQLFFGKPEEAVKHIEQIQQKMSDNESIILLTDSKIYGSNVTSISKEVHRQIIDRLGKNR